MLWPGPSSGWAYTLAALTWDIVFIGIMVKVVISVLGLATGIPVAIAVIVLVIADAVARTTE